MNRRTEKSRRFTGARLILAALAGATLPLAPVLASDWRDLGIRGGFDVPAIDYTDRPILAGSKLRTGYLFTGNGKSGAIAYALRQALSTDPKLRETLADSHAQRTDVWKAYAAFLPTVTASIRQTYGNDLEGSPTPASTVERRSVAAVDLSLPLFTSGSRLYGIKRARAEAAAADYDVLAAENDVMSEAANAYLELIAARRRQDALQRSVRAVGSIAEITRVKSRKGFADRYDIALADAKLSQVRREYERAVEQRENAENEFRYRIGALPPDVLANPPGNLMSGDTVEEAVAKALKRNPRLLSARQQARAAKYGVREAVGKRLPRFDLTGSYEDGFDGIDQGEKWTVGVKLTVPLIDPDAIPEIGRSRYQAAAARYRAQDVQRAVEKLIRNEWSAYHSAEIQIGHEGKRLEQLRRAAIAASKRYEHGYAAIDDVLSRQIEVLDSEVALADLEARKLASAFRIAIEVGS